MKNNIIKNRLVILFFITIILPTNKINCTLGCMDNSYHMTRACDFKNYHYVECGCPCTSISGHKGRCRDCLHYGNPNRGEINSLQLLDQIFR